MTSPPPFLLYRTLGNDLPPRHRAGQTLDRLRFILEHEPPHEGCEKRWILNRIVDPAAEAAARRLIEAAGQRWLRIPFSLAEYARLPYAWEGLPEDQYHHAPAFLDLPLSRRAIAVEWCLRERNRYVTNLNGARNVALAEGRAVARWVLPLDGQLFLTADAWAAIRAAAAAPGDARYLIVPMARLLDDAVVLRGGPPPAADHEPSIAFRSDATETFDESLRYGYANKAALLARLGVSGAWTPSEQALAVAARNGPSPDAGRFRWAGWVARLTSGNADADRDDGQRVHARVTALFTFLNRLDERVMLRHWRVGEPLLYRRRVRLEPWIVQGLDAAARHPSSAPGALDVRAIVAAALAAAATGQRRLADACVARIRMAGPGLNAVWRQIAALEERPGEGPLPVAGVTPLACVLDAALVARSLGAVADADMASLQGLARATLERLAPDRQGRAALTARDAVGTWYEVLVLTLAAFAGDLATMREVLERAPMRIAQQFAPDGAQPDAAMGDDPLGGAVRNLEGWACLAWMARPLGHDLWTGRTGDGRSPAVGLAHLAQHAARLPALDGRRRRTEALARLAAPSAGTRGAPFAEPDPGSCLPPFLPLLLAAAAEPRYGSGGA